MIILHWFVLPFFGITPKGLMWILDNITVSEDAVPTQAIRRNSNSSAMYAETTYG